MLRLQLGLRHSGSSPTGFTSAGTHRYWYVYLPGRPGNNTTQDMAISELIWEDDNTATDVSGEATITFGITLADGNAATLTDGLTTANLRWNEFNPGAHTRIELDFGSGNDKGLYRLGIYPRTTFPELSPYYCAVYYSDDNITYTLYYIGKFNPQPNAVAAYYYALSPEANEIWAGGANTHVGFYSLKQNRTTNVIGELRYYSAGSTEIMGSNVTPTSLAFSSESGSNVATRLYDNNAALIYAAAASGSGRYEPIMVTFELAGGAAVLASADITAGAVSGSSCPTVFAFLSGDGETFVPVGGVQNESAFSNGETRSFTL